MVFSRFWKRNKGPAQATAAPAVPDGCRVYAIGDIHGRDDLFAQLLTMIADDHAARRPAQPIIILLGDLVDRGPHSRQVVERAMTLSADWPDVRLLMGNHEEVFLEALGGDIAVMRFFVRIGGAQTIHSYGIVGREYDAMDFAELAVALARQVPQTHIQFLSNALDLIEIGDYAFVHAGIRPGIALAAQSPSDLRWIRDEFLDDSRDHGKIIVYGHSITDGVDEQPNRIGIDTGAFASGILTAIALEGQQRWYLSTAPVVLK